MGNHECKIHLDAVREVYMLAVLNLKMSCNRHPPPMDNPHNEELKIGDIMLIKIELCSPQLMQNIYEVVE